MKNKIAIIGCGNVGSCIAYALCLKYGVDNTHKNNSLKELILVDPDILEFKNLPLGPILSKYSYEQFKDFPKVFALNKILTELLEDKNTKLPINAIIDPFPDCMNDINIRTTMLIDCRDDSTSNSIFKFKLASDNKYSRIVINPINKKGKPTNYSIGRSEFYSMKTAYDFVYKLENLIKIKEKKEYIINYDKGGDWDELPSRK